MGLDCSKLDDWNYDPVSESPARYVADMRKRMQMTQFAVVKEEILDEENMTADELREYYDRVGKNKLDSLDAAG